MIGFKPVIEKNRRKLDVYTHAVATTPQGRSSHYRIWREGERSLPSIRTESLLGFFTSGRLGDFLKVPNTNSVVSPIPCASAQPYGPGSGNHGQLFGPHQDTSARYGMALGDLCERPYFRLLSPPFYGGEFVHRTHVVVVGWEAQNSSRQAYGDRISYRNQLVCWSKTVNKKAGTDHAEDLVVCAKLLNLVLFQKVTSFYLIKQTTQ